MTPNPSTTIPLLEAFLNNPDTYSTLHTIDTSYLDDTADLYIQTFPIPGCSKQQFRQHFIHATSKEQLVIHELLNTVYPQDERVSRKDVKNLSLHFNKAGIEQELFAKAIILLARDQVKLLLDKISIVEESERTANTQQQFQELEHQIEVSEVNHDPKVTNSDDCAPLRSATRGKRKRGGTHSGRKCNTSSDITAVEQNTHDLTTKERAGGAQNEDNEKHDGQNSAPTKKHLRSATKSAQKDPEECNVVRPEGRTRAKRQKRQHGEQVATTPGSYVDSLIKDEGQKPQAISSSSDLPFAATKDSIQEISQYQEAKALVTTHSHPSTSNISEDRKDVSTSVPTTSSPTSNLSSPLSIPLSSPPSTPPPPSRSRNRKIKSPTKSPYFPSSTSSTPRKRVQRTPRSSDGLPMSLKPFPPLSSPTFGIAQERLAHNPFQLLIAVQFLNKTRGSVAMPVFRDLITTYPTPELLAAANITDIVPRIRHLGLQNQRAAKIINIAKAWLASPPERGKRYRTLHYPWVGAGKDIKPDEVLGDEDDGEGNERVGAWEVAHIPGCGDYAIDSWRIFCRDVLRGVAGGYNGERDDGTVNKSAIIQAEHVGEVNDNNNTTPAEPNTRAAFEPEWQRVLPKDKELRAYLRWMWLKHDWVWDPITGERKVASKELLEEAEKGDLAWREKDEVLVVAKVEDGDVDEDGNGKGIVALNEVKDVVVVEVGKGGGIPVTAEGISGEPIDEIPIVEAVLADPVLIKTEQQHMQAPTTEPKECQTPSPSPSPSPTATAPTTTRRKSRASKSTSSSSILISESKSKPQRSRKSTRRKTKDSTGVADPTS